MPGYVLHHAEAVIKNLVTSVRPGGALLLIDPDFLPVSVADPPEVRAFWERWLAWSRERGIDHYIGRSVASRLAAIGLTPISGTAETAVYNGGSPCADYSLRRVSVPRNDLSNSGKVDEALVDTFLAWFADSNWWTQTIAFTAVHGRVIR